MYLLDKIDKTNLDQEELYENNEDYINAKNIWTYYMENAIDENEWNDITMKTT